MAKKTTCPITRAQFRAKAKPVTITINNGTPMELEVKDFSTGSIGWFANTKVTIEVDGIRLPVQANLMLTVVGSKDLPPDEAPTAGSGTPAPAQES
jgi:hypothetical protein